MTTDNDSIFEFDDHFQIASPFGDWQEEQRIENQRREDLEIEKYQSLLSTIIKQNVIIPVPLKASSKKLSTSKAGFDRFIKKIREFENKLINHDKATYKNIEERIHVLRGIYYGTTWSVDYKSEGSPVRNAAFQIYTASPKPIDPRPIIGKELYQELFNYAEIYKDTKKSSGIDFGHTIIGLDARRKFLSRESGLPAHGGCTGLEITTWIGDIGGGAGMLAINRIKNPNKRAKDMFRGSSFGGWINLEGDIAAYLIARDISEIGTPSISFSENEFIAGALENYLLNKDEKNQWKNRAKIFLEMLGAEFDHDDNITNIKEVGIHTAAKIASFAELYMANRLRQNGNVSTDQLIAASSHLIGASTEMTLILLNTLIKAIKSEAKSRIEAKGFDPSPTKKGEPFKKYVLAKIAEVKARQSEKKAKELFKQGDKFLDEIESWYEGMLKKL